MEDRERECTHVLQQTLWGPVHLSSQWNVSTLYVCVMSTLDKGFVVFPETVLGLTNTSLSETSVTLNWMYQYSESTSTTLRMEIEIRRIGEDQPTDRRIGPEETTVVISSLSPLTSYNITVYVVNGVGRSEPSTIQVATLSLSEYTHTLYIVIIETTCRTVPTNHLHVHPSIIL